MRKLLTAALLAAVPFGLLVYENPTTAAERGILGRIFSKKKNQECDNCATTPASEPKKVEPKKTEPAPAPKKVEAPAKKVEPAPTPKKVDAPAKKVEPAPAPKKVETPPTPKKTEPATPKKIDAPATPKKTEPAPATAPKKVEAPAKKVEPAPAQKKIEVASAKKVVAETTQPANGFVSLFNGKDLKGWWGFGTSDPRKFKALSKADQDKQKAKNLEDILAHWKVEGNEIVNDGKGLYLTTEKEYGDYELQLEYKMLPKGDSGVYLKYTPQVQIWDFTNKDQFKLGADKGSGGLWNNSPGTAGKDPLVLADKPLGEWNKFRIIQVGARTTIYLNDKLVVDNAILENYFDRKLPLLPKGAIQLQTHGSEIRWKNILLREIPADEAAKLLASKGNSGFTPIFDGKTLNGWTGAKDNYEVIDGSIQCKKGKGGVLYTENKYSDYIVRLEFLTPPGGNNGLAIRYPGGAKDAAYIGMTELQVLDNEDPKYAKLDARQYHGSAYGMAPAQRGYLRPAGTWNFQEVTVKGSTIKVELNGNIILDTDLSKITEYMAKSPHPGKELKEGYFGFAGHNDPVRFRNLAIKTLAK